MKKYVVWVVAFAVVLAGAWALLRQPSASAPEQPQNTVAGEATSDNKDPQDAITGNGGASAADLDDDQGANDGAQEDTEDDASTLIPSTGIPTIHEKLTWEAINSFPIKTTDMSEDEMRSLCVEFFRFTKTALWTPDENVKFIKNDAGAEDTMSKGIVYGGLPYVTRGSGNIYRLMDFMDESTGEVDISQFLTDSEDASKLAYFGNQCSTGAYWGWGRVMNSAKYNWTQYAVPSCDFIMLGTYTNSSGFDINKISTWSKTDPDEREDGKVVTDADDGTWSTAEACAAVGQQQMYENYALFKKGDGLVYYTTAGHIVMVATDAVVNRLEDGTIDGENSYITTIDQAQSWADGKNNSGDSYRYKKGVETKRTFADLYAKAYLPFTFKEFLGTDPVEETEVTFSYEGSTITASQLFSATVTSNYGISDAYAIVTDSSGNEVYRHIVRSNRAWRKTMNMVESGENVVKLGSLEAGTYNIEIVVQLATGERPTIYMGKLIA